MSIGRRTMPRYAWNVWKRLSSRIVSSWFFFFQAEDGIRDLTVTGVQTCALPISPPRKIFFDAVGDRNRLDGFDLSDRHEQCIRNEVQADHGIQGIERSHAGRREIGRASCRERV